MIKPAIFEQDFAKVLEKVTLISKFAECIHIDVADGILVDGKTFEDVRLIDQLTPNCEIEVHLMCSNPIEMLKKIPNNVHTVISQLDAGHTTEFLSECKKLNITPAFSISPNYDYSKIVDHLDLLGFIQFMSVIPGGQARSFHSEVLNNINSFKTEYPHVAIQIDGAMHFKTVNDIEKNINIEHYVVGSDIFKNIDPVSEYKKLENIIYKI